ncbi:unnamed protein product [Porites lobata]|uniref:Acyltransferase n=1 Tax=Porites lobata TaxID=104759 RepID=A0ABN8MW38_9CNID|nr:unnamed protein product [Porites lobata]
MKDYYPITLVKTSELDPQKNYIFGYHPHGFFTEGASIGFGTDACGFGEKFPGIIPHLAVHSGKNSFSSSLAFLVIVLSLYVTQRRERGSLSPSLRALLVIERVLVKAWLYRDMLMSLGIVDATLDSLKYVLAQMGAGHSIVLVVGGAAEVNNCRPDSYVLLFSRGKGFIKLALETGCDLVPVFAFGQNNLFPLVGGGYNSRFSRFQRWLYSKTHAGCVCCWGLSWCLPKRSAIFVVGKDSILMYFIAATNVLTSIFHTGIQRTRREAKRGSWGRKAVGSPIPVEKVENPTQETINKLHSRYIEDIKELYKKYVKAYHPTDKSELLIV